MTDWVKMTWSIGAISAEHCLSTIDGISSGPGDLFVSSSQSNLKMPSVENDISGIDGYEDSAVGMSVRFSFVNTE